MKHPSPKFTDVNAAVAAGLTTFTKAFDEDNAKAQAFYDERYAAEQAAKYAEAMQAVREWKALSPDDVLKITDPEWLIDALILSGKVGTFVGAGGTIKTTLLIELMQCIATGEQFFGFPVGRVGSSVLLSGEDDQADLNSANAHLLKARLERAPKPERRRIIDAVRTRVRLISLRGIAPPLVKAEGRDYEETPVPELLIAELEGIEDLRLVVLDTLRRFAQASSNDESAMTKALRGAEKLSEKLPTRPTVIFPHHTTKQAYRDGNVDQYAATGSSAIVDNTRFGMNLRRATVEEARKTHNMDETTVALVESGKADLIEVTPSRGSLLAKKPERFFIARVDWSLVRADIGHKTAAEQEQDDVLAIVRRVGQLIAAGGKATQTAIFSKKNGNGGLGGDTGENGTRMARAVAAGYLVEPEKVKDGYTLTDAGRAKLPLAPAVSAEESAEAVARLVGAGERSPFSMAAAANQ